MDPGVRLGVPRLASRGPLGPRGHGGYAAEVRFSGTHTGPLASPGGKIAPTGRPFAFDYLHVSRLAGDQIASDHIYFDQLGFLNQLGLLPA